MSVQEVECAFAVDRVRADEPFDFARGHRCPVSPGTGDAPWRIRRPRVRRRHAVEMAPFDHERPRAISAAISA